MSPPFLGDLTEHEVFARDGAARGWFNIVSVWIVVRPGCCRRLADDIAAGRRTGADGTLLHWSDIEGSEIGLWAL
jgi:hypothetical protein